MKLKYFLDHQSIKRNKSPGNGNTPGTLAEKINWGGKNTADQNAKISNTKSTTSTQSTSSNSSSGGVMSTLKSMFNKK